MPTFIDPTTAPQQRVTVEKEPSSFGFYLQVSGFRLTSNQVLVDAQAAADVFNRDFDKLANFFATQEQSPGTLQANVAPDVASVDTTAVPNQETVLPPDAVTN